MALHKLVGIIQVRVVRYQILLTLPGTMVPKTRNPLSAELKSFELISILLE